MSRPFALRTEILAGFDQAAPEILLPNPVDGNPRRERIVLADQPSSEPQPVRRRFGRLAAKNGGHTGVYLIVPICESSTYANEVGRARDTGLFTHDQRGGDPEPV